MKFMGDLKRDRQETNNELIAAVLRVSTILFAIVLKNIMCECY